MRQKDLKSIITERFTLNYVDWYFEGNNAWYGKRALAPNTLTTTPYEG
jgi:hypothetical protein